MRMRQSPVILESVLYRLPTEAEWEKAARYVHSLYTWGPIPLSKLAFYSESSSTHQTIGTGDCTSTPRYCGAQEVMQRDPNELLIYDIYGNVAEWTGDWYGELDERSAVDPTSPNEGSNKVTRGGSWMDPGDQLKPSARSPHPPETRSIAIGFRPVRTILEP